MEATGKVPNVASETQENYVCIFWCICMYVLVYFVSYWLLLLAAAGCYLLPAGCLVVACCWLRAS